MEGEKNQYQGVAGEQEEEVKSRGLFDFMKKKEENEAEKEEKKKEEEVIVSGMENVHVTEEEKMETEKKDQEKKEGLFAKLHRSDSSSSSSVSLIMWSISEHYRIFFFIKLRWNWGLNGSLVFSFFNFFFKLIFICMSFYRCFNLARLF